MNVPGARLAKVSFKQTVRDEAVPTSPEIGRVAATTVLEIWRLRLGRMRRFPRPNDENDKNRVVREFSPREKCTFKTVYFFALARQYGGKFKNLVQMRQIAVGVFI